MTAKEKARKIYNEHYMTVLSASDVIRKHRAKECALITANEVLDVCKGIGLLIGYWQEVKSEIEKL